ncbi:hypothetical protein CGRA01v4_13816 [Colletotrichum graminicola]|nr:hypothetical protein CGRA01v4_13816 [Colletotrichum graminicola]
MRLKRRRCALNLGRLRPVSLDRPLYGRLPEQCCEKVVDPGRDGITRGLFEPMAIQKNAVCVFLVKIWGRQGSRQ